MLRDFFVNDNQMRKVMQSLIKGSFTQAIWVGDFAQRCDFKIEKSVSNHNRQRQVLIVLTPV